MIRPPTIAALLASICLAACAPTGAGRPGPVIEPEPPEPSPAAAGWSYQYAPGEYRYRIVNEATIRSARDSAAAAESITTTLLIRYDIDRANTVLALQGTVDSFGVQGTTRVPPATQRIPLPIAFSATLDREGRLLTFHGPEEVSCGSAAGALLAAARELLPLVPARLAPGDRWYDTVTSTVCRGEVPITTTAEQEYTVRGPAAFEGRAAILVSRSSRITVAGEGAQASQPVSVTGAGVAQTELFLDVASGRFLGSTGDYTADITFTAGRVEQPFRQQVRQRVTLE